jgi:arylsulfatase A-like enzyme
LASTIDVVPTLLHLAGLDMPELDGLSLLSISEGEVGLLERPLFFHFPHYHGSGNRPSGAVIAGRFKLIEWFETGDVELYDLARDEGELADLAAALPVITDSLLKMMREWRLEVDANMPTSNPDWSMD